MLFCKIHGELPHSKVDQVEKSLQLYRQSQIISTHFPISKIFRHPFLCNYRFVFHLIDHSSSPLISANADLLKFFGKCKDGKTRLVKVSIVDGN